MACPTCKRTDVPDTCGSRVGDKCMCCGLTIIATAEDSSNVREENHNNEEREGTDNNS